MVVRSTSKKEPPAFLTVRYNERPAGSGVRPVPACSVQARSGVKLLGAAALLLLLAAACGPRPSTVLGQSAGGCREAVGERTGAIASIDAAEKQAAQRNAARAAELQAVASEAKGSVMGTADLAQCDRPEPASGGVVVDLADLRQRYRVVVDQATARLGDIASLPAPVVPQRSNDKRGSKGGTKGD